MGRLAAPMLGGSSPARPHQRSAGRDTARVAGRWAPLIGAASLVFVSAAHAQPVQPSTVITAPNDNEVEVIGLRRWTVQMIQDSLDRYSPGDSITKHNRAAVMRYKLHFADAAAINIPGFNDRARRPYVTTTRPGYSSGVSCMVLST